MRGQALASLRPPDHYNLESGHASVKRHMDEKRASRIDAIEDLIAAVIPCNRELASAVLSFDNTNCRTRESAPDHPFNTIGS